MPLVRLNGLFFPCAKRLMDGPKVSWRRYVEFMRRCGLECYRDDKFGLPRVCVAPLDGAPKPLLHDCLGMTEQGDLERLCRAHLERVVVWARTNLTNRTFDVSPSFLRHIASCDGFFSYINSHSVGAAASFMFIGGS